MLTGLVPASQAQADLFDDQDRGKSKRLMSALDAINDRWEGRHPPVPIERHQQNVADLVSPPVTCLHD